MSCDATYLLISPMENPNDIFVYSSDLGLDSGKLLTRLSIIEGGAVVQLIQPRSTRRPAIVRAEKAFAA